MTDRHHVFIIDKSQFNFEDNLNIEDEYDLYDLWKAGMKLPDGVWYEEWFVNDGEDPAKSQQAHNHFLMAHETHPIYWSELDDEFTGIKPDVWWKERIEMMEQMYNLMKSMYPLAERLVKEVQEITDPDGESIHQAMEGESHWPDYYTLGHWISMAKTALPEEEPKDDE
jgi:hypothetical protein